MSNRAWLVFAASLLALWWLFAGGDNAVKAPSTAPTSTDTTSFSDARPASIAEVLRGAHVQLETSLDFTRARLEGVVLDEKKEPLGKAIVHIGSQVTTASDDGSFAFDNIATGDVLITAELGDLYGERSTNFSEDDDLIEVEVRRGPTLTVHVVSAKTAQPIAGAALDIGRFDRLTDANGVAVFRGLDPEGERISVAADGYASIRVDVPIDEARPYAPIAMTLKLESGAAIKGVVLDPSGAVVPDAHVRVETAAGNRVDTEYTDEHGAFVIPAVAAGSVTIVASSRTFIEGPKQLLQHDGIHALTDIKVHVLTGAEVAGRVVDETGKPVAGVVLDGLLCDDTDADGRFLAQGLEAGERTVFAHDGLRGSVPQKITVEIGKRQELTFVLSATSIAGKVVDKHGNGIPDATVYAHLTTDEYTSAMATTDEFGAFDLGGVAPGSWRVVAQRPEESSRPMPDTGGVTVKAGARDVKLELPELSTLAARVMLDGQPVTFYGVRIVQHVDSADGDSDWGGRTDNVNDDNGAFERSDLAPGGYDITIVGPNFKKKKLSGVTLREGGRTDLGTLAMDRGRTVHGHVVDEHHVPIADALVAIGSVPNRLSDSPISQRMTGDATARTDASGAFEISGLEQENAKIVAKHGTDGVSIMRELPPADDNIELVLVETGDVAGTIDNYTDDAGSVATVQDTHGNNFDGDIDALGNFTVHGVPPGDASVTIYGKNSLSAEKITVVAGQTVSVHFALSKNPIEIEITYTTSNECIWTTIDGGGVHGSASCDNNVAAFHAVPPGTYDTCIDGNCGSFTVAPSPATQHIAVTLVRPDPPPSDDTPTPDEPSTDVPDDPVPDPIITID